MKMLAHFNCVFALSLMHPSCQSALNSFLTFYQFLLQQVITLMYLNSVIQCVLFFLQDATDYAEITSSNNPLVAFTSDPSTHRQCFNVNITDDEALEDTERFNLRLTLLGGSIPVVVSPDISVVEIIDNDCKYSTTPLRFENYNTFYPCYTQSYVSALKWISYQSVKVLAQLSCVFGSSLMLLYFQIMRRSTSFSILCLQLDQLVRHYTIMDTHRRSQICISYHTHRSRRLC